MERQHQMDPNLYFLYGVTVGSKFKEPLSLTQKAVAFATECHKNEKRDDNEPYISHPIATCTTLAMLNIDEDVILAAMILHDVVENKHTTLEIIKNEFGEEVANLVDIQTKREGEDTKEYYTRVGSEIVGILCKGSDRLHNISNMIDLNNLPRLKRYVEETEQSVIPMLDNARFQYLKYANALGLLYGSILNIVKIAKCYIESEERAIKLAAKI